MKKQILAPTVPDMTPDEQQHMELSRKLAGECVVLMENDGTLPLAPGKLALYGSGARRTVKGGTGSGDVNSRFVVTAEEGLEKAGFLILTKTWLDKQDQHVQEAKEAHRQMVHQKAQETGMPEMLFELSMPFHEPAPAQIAEEDLKNGETDTAFYIISRNSGEGADRYAKEGDYQLWQEEVQQIHTLAEQYKHLVLILNIGGLVDLAPVKEIEGVNAILLMSQLGNIGGYALADVLTGAVNPSGKLTDTWAAHYEDYPSSAGFSHNNGDTDDDSYTEGIYVGYRYFDQTDKEVLYPFGYGLSYTTFSMEAGQVSVEEEKLKVTVKVTNTGKVAGKEVVQVYVSAPEGALDKPYQELKGYAKTPLLQAGESGETLVEIPLRRLASYSEEKAAWILEKGDYVLRAGASSRDTAPVAVLQVQEEILSLQCTNICPMDISFEEKKNCEKKADLSQMQGLPVVTLGRKDLATVTTSYQGERREMTTAIAEKLTLEDVLTGKATLEDLVAQLSVRELASYAVGRHVEAGEDSVIGNASLSVPGAAGDTSAICAESRNIPSVSMADGPAGLRLQPHFKARHDGTVLPGGSKLGDVVEPFPEYDDPEDVVDHYQYTTAIPIGWALAQSWNQELVEQAADMVGAEMEKFGVDIWLTPAMNIHRNPLCGRNFEYYSEDPVVTGLTAAAITRGVQGHAGKGVSVKHFACNNQEDNRYQTNVHISERALREIYLRGFEICIRESQPETIMTSYNLVNGIHTANSHDLLQKVVRDEWGYKGLIMTDWYSTEGLDGLSQSATGKYPWGSQAGAVYAGNDIQMPGSASMEDAIVKAVESGEKDAQGFSCTKADLQFCAANVLRGVLYAQQK